MYLTGFADEASPSIDGQIKATLALGWQNIESRNIDGKNIHDMDDAAFDVVAGKLEDAGVHINCFGSAIANWGKPVDKPYDDSLAEVKRAIPRMQRLGTEMVRLMSFAVLRDRGPDDQMFEERVKRLKEIVPMFTDAGILPVHENCMNYGGMGCDYTLRLLDAVPGMPLVFDTGNPPFTKDYAKGEPYPRQSTWEFYRNVRDHIAYVHIKDAMFIEDKGDAIFPEATFTYPGEGDGDVVRVVEDLVATGYDGGFSMEPHMKVVFHEEDGGTADDARIENYVEYGRRFEALLAAATAAAGQGAAGKR
ncbi:MAG: TIM barrel protein [Kiritimatiellia bacterium]|jgi:sugar phosphate isomerase/epimerase|nr:TIM barrel protein [Kiritimatiellia bacterium]MDP6630752.1 TIM barrel protein [Kiritimatiellia bacterium]MDP6809385.1 TIM barrel protein [Kiritimatiellia bacterium]MDP7023938.1 TIM barrel protein [Kiritimatiellia bacterium]